jgi:hypothetical protein
MEEQAKSVLVHPLTFEGVAGLARSSFGRLFLFQSLVALLAAAMVVWFFQTAWVPALLQGIRALPPSGSIQDGLLDWTPPTPVRTGGTSFLSVSVDPTDSFEPGEGSDLQVEFGRTGVRVRSLFGYLGVPYPPEYVIVFNRTELEPWWGAWQPMILAGLGVAVFLGLLTIWAVLGAVYSWPARFIAFYADRKLTWPGAWRLGAAALLPGALFFILALFAYSLHRLNLVQLLFAAVLHLMIGWVYLLGSPFCLPRSVAPSAAVSVAKNPFGKGKPAARNPFADSSGKA